MAGGRRRMYCASNVFGCPSLATKDRRNRLNTISQLPHHQRAVPLRIFDLSGKGVFMTRRFYAFVVLALTLFVQYPAYATNGLDTPPGVATMPFNIEGTQVMLLNQNGLGLGASVAPVTSGNLASTLQLGNELILQNTVGNQLNLSNNAYHNGTAWIYATTDYATALRMYSGNIYFYAAPSGTAGSPISYYDGTDIRMTILNDGYVGIGTTTPQAPLDVNGGIRGSNISSIAVGSPCSPEGMLAYDMSNHEPVYCSSSLVWTPSSGGGATYVSSWVSLPCPVATSQAINLGSYVPSGATAVEVVMQLTAGCAAANGYVDSTNNTFCVSWLSGGAAGASCAGSVVVANGTHTFGSVPTGCGYSTCKLSVAGYFQ
jgi:hypothetical protein